MPVSWFERKKNQPEKLTNTVTQGCRVIQGFTQRYVAYLILIVLNILFSLIGAVAFDWRTGLTAVGLIPLIMVSQAIQLAFIKGLTESKDKIYT
jgi:ABC-type transport system involved in cytochrome bd biosynthesis fused ATPase/permease subunit